MAIGDAIDNNMSEEEQGKIIWKAEGEDIYYQGNTEKELPIRCKITYMLDEKEIYAVVTDYEMPQMNGFELTKQIISKLPTMKIIVMSGHDTKYLEILASKQEIDKNKVKFLCKSDIINLVVMLNS